MSQIIKINDQDCYKVQVLLEIYNGYLNVLNYLLTQTNIDENNEFIDKKFEEAVICNIELERVENEIAEKYSPNEYLTEYLYNFKDSSIEFFNDKESIQ